MPRPTALDAARQFRQHLANDEAQAAQRMATVYNRIFTDLQGDLAKLSVDIAAMEEPTRGAIMRLARMQAIQQQVKEQATKFGGTVQNEVTIVQSQSIEAGIANALKLMEVSLPALPDDIRRQITGSFARLPADAVEAAAGLTGKDSPLNERLTDLYGEYVAEQVGNHITDGIAKGDNPRTIARQLEKNVLSGLGSGLTSALTTVRTAQIKSYQLANHATYLANNNIVKGWIWHAELGSACLSCTAMHGSEHPLDETLTDHHSGRCSPVPATITYADLGLDIPETVEPMQTGEDWFNEQPASVQREMMGGAMYDAWQDDRFAFGELSRPYSDPVYGELLREASLKDILGDAAKEFYR